MNDDAELLCRYADEGSESAFAELVQRLGLDQRFVKRQYDRRLWPELRAVLTETLRSRSRDDWCAIMEGTDVCFAPVLTMSEATRHPHMVAREVFILHDGQTQPAPAPRFSRTPSAARLPVQAVLGDMVKEWQS